MKSVFILAHLFFLFFGFCYSQPGIEWQHCLGGTDIDNGVSIIQDQDGNYYVGGNTLSVDGDVTDNHGGMDAWIIKLNSTGGIIWQKCFGGTNLEELTALSSGSGENVIASSRTRSFDGDITGNHSVTG